MSDELFYKIIKEGKEMGVTRYSPFMNGEPFIFPKIWNWLDHMEKEGVKVALYTNGEHIDVDRIVKYKNIEYLNFSINATNAETHKKVMRGPDFDKVTENYFKAREKAKFLVRASLVKTEANVAEVDEFNKKFVKTEVCEFSNWTDSRHSTLEKKGKRIPCWVLFNQMFILWDGTVVPCCMDFDGKQVMGDANTQSLKEIWEYSDWMRKRHRQNDFDSVAVCRGCNYNVVV
jgi:radical SAM protein with 4Fe4S-binding SPASM domain